MTDKEHHLQNIYFLLQEAGLEITKECHYAKHGLKGNDGSFVKETINGAVMLLDDIWPKNER